MNKHTPELTQFQLPFDEIPYGYCHCGCGQKTKIATQSNTKREWVKGEPIRFIFGHRKPKYASLEEHFWAHCLKGAPNECWEWTGAKIRFGYGRIKRLGREHMAHRVSYELHYGPIPDGMLVCHHCDNPPCTNPDHLFLGTYTDNNRDMINKGRENYIRGSEIWPSKLTEEDVAEIRKIYASSQISQRQIARDFGIDPNTVCKIVHRKSWKHVIP